MEDSDFVAFDIIREEGAICQARKILLRQGRTLFGKPSSEQKSQLEAIENLPRLNRLFMRTLKVKSWDALLRGR